VRTETEARCLREELAELEGLVGSLMRRSSLRESTTPTLQKRSDSGKVSFGGVTEVVQQECSFIRRSSLELASAAAAAAAAASNRMIATTVAKSSEVSPRTAPLECPHSPLQSCTLLTAGALTQCTHSPRHPCTLLTATAHTAHVLPTASVTSSHCGECTVCVWYR
jgi:hypothetical protein